MNFYRKKDADLVPASAAFSALLTANYAAYGLVVGQATAYAALNTAWASAFATAVEPETRTKSAVEAKNQARKNLVASAKQLSDFISGNPAVSNSQLIDLGLDPRTERVPGPVPDSAPGIHIKSVSGWDVLLKLDDTTTPRRGKPTGCAGASVFSYIGPAAPASIADWKFEGNTGRVNVTVSFEDTLTPGTLVWFTAFWFNERKQSGPAATPVSARVAGTGVSMAA